MEEAKKPILHQATVVWVKNLAGEYYHARFRLEEPNRIDFTAGQYVIFHIGPPKLRHTLSIASPPSDKNFIDILQGTAPMGEGSKWILGLKPGDPVTFVGPVGKFVIPPDTGKQKVFVATGCGIAPFRSMIFDQQSPIILYWGLRYETDLFWQDEFEDFAREHANFHYHVTLSKLTESWRGAGGRVTDHVIPETKNLLDSEFYLCGNREMIADVRKQLTDKGVSADQIFTETFF